MLDNEIYPLLISTIEAGLIPYGLSTTEVWQKNQPTQQGILYTPQIFLTKIADHRYGFLGREDRWDSLDSKMIHTEEQVYESTFQVNALSIQDPTNQTQITAADLVNITAAILQGDQGRETLRAGGLGILRIMDIRNPYFKDDRNQFEASPSFDFTVVHDQTVISQSPVVDTIVFNIARV
jgi:hypothetical protein